MTGRIKTIHRLAEGRLFTAGMVSVAVILRVRDLADSTEPVFSFDRQGATVPAMSFLPRLTFRSRP